MKGNFKFLTIVVAVLLASTLLLTGCMYAIAASNGEAKQYDLDAMSDSAGENVNVGINPNGPQFDAPTSQTELQKKFAVYTLESERQLTLTNGSMTQHGVQFFSEEQAEELKAKRDNGEIVSLSYDEILYIISDSINQYFSNDYIILTRASSSKFIPEERKQRSQDHHITCGKADYSIFVNAQEIDFSGAKNQYDTMINDILDIITFRIGMLDTTFVFAEIYKNNATWLVVENNDPILLSGNGDASELPNENDKFPPVRTAWIKLLGETELDNYEEVIRNTANAYESSLKLQTYDGENEAFPLLVVDCNDSFISKTDEEAVFPTIELTEMAPDIARLEAMTPTRQLFELMVNEIYPEYDITLPTEKMPITAYKNGIKEGMNFKELVDAFGIPYNSSLSGLLGGCYITDEDDVILVYLGFDSENYYVTDVKW